MLQWVVAMQKTTMRIMAVIVVAIVLAACGGSDDPQPDAPPTQMATPTDVIIPTWTPIPSPTLRPTSTPAPTFTSAASAPTFAPPAQTGLGEIGDQVVVTILERDLNEAILQAYTVADLGVVNASPVVTFEPGSQIQVEITLTNAFFDELSFVTLRAKLEIMGGQIRVEELQERRAWTGPTPSDRDIWPVFDLVERSINRMIFDLLSLQPGTSTLTLISLRQFADLPQVRARLEAIFVELE